mgnify:CR=1 FL=1|jgi:hypothetical protein
MEKHKTRIVVVVYTLIIFVVGMATADIILAEEINWILLLEATALSVVWFSILLTYLEKQE